MEERKSPQSVPKAAPSAGSWRWTRENLEAIIAAVTVALLIRTFAAEPYSIPTGSMAPTLLGAHLDLRCPTCASPISAAAPYDMAEIGSRVTCANCGIVGIPGSLCTACGRPLPPESGPLPRDLPAGKCPHCLEPLGSGGGYTSRTGDKILVDKVSYRFRSPRRWEVAVFRRPGRTSMNFVKRIVGLPGDEIQLLGGDIVVNGRIAPKPERVQDRLWIPVHPGKGPGGGLGPWRPEGEGWETEGGVLEGSSAAGEVRARFVRSIDDRQGYNALRGGDGDFPVGDVRLSATVTVEEGEALLVLERNGTEVVAALGADGRATLEAGEAAAEAQAPPPKGTGAAGSLQILDGTISVVLGGSVAIRLPAPWAPGDVRTSRAAVGVRGGRARFERLRVERDIHYFVPRESRLEFPYKVPPGEYLLFGDNSPSSKDSRYLGAVPEENFVGRALQVFWPIAPWRIQRIR